MFTSVNHRLLTPLLVLTVFVSAVGAGSAMARTRSVLPSDPLASPPVHRPAARTDNDTTDFEIFGDFNQVGASCCSFGSAILDFAQDEWSIDVMLHYWIKDGAGTIVGDAYAGLSSNHQNGQDQHFCIGEVCGAVTEFDPIVIEGVSPTCAPVAQRGSSFHWKVTALNSMPAAEPELTYELDPVESTWSSQFWPHAGAVTDATGCTVLGVVDVCPTDLSDGNYWWNGIYKGYFDEHPFAMVTYNFKVLDSEFERISWRVDADKHLSGGLLPFPDNLCPYSQDAEGFMNPQTNGQPQQWQGAVPGHPNRGWDLRYTLEYRSCLQGDLIVEATVEPDGTFTSSHPDVFKVDTVRPAWRCTFGYNANNFYYKDFFVNLLYKEQWTDAQSTTWKLKPTSGIWEVDMTAPKMRFGDASCLNPLVLCPSYKRLLKGHLERWAVADPDNPADWPLDTNYAHVLVKTQQ